MKERIDDGYPGQFSVNTTLFFPYLCKCKKRDWDILYKGKPMCRNCLKKYSDKEI